MDDIKLVSLYPYRNYPAMIYAIITFILYIAFFAYMINSENKFDNAYSTLAGSLSILFIVGVIWIYKIAKITGQQAVPLVIVGTAIPYLVLFILSLKDYNIKDEKLKKVVNNTRSEFIREIEIARNQGYSGIHVKEKYEKIIKERSIEVITKSKLEVVKQLIDDGIIDRSIDLKRKEDLIKEMELNKLSNSDVSDWQESWNDDETLCPACGVNIVPDINNCINCGLKLK